VATLLLEDGAAFLLEDGTNLQDELGSGSAPAALYPPCGFAIDGRAENPRVYPPGKELASNANAGLAHD
jgi:hypothetical protein